MTMRVVLLSGVMCAGLLGGAAMAEASGALVPNGSWAVSKVEARSGNPPYCALARRFSNGSLLTFARNTNDENSLALDLPKGTFKTGQEETIILNPGMGEARRFQTKPLSDRGVVIRLGRDQAFFSTLEKTGALEVTAAGQVVSYTLADMADGVRDLAACLGPMQGGGDSTPGEVRQAAAEAPLVSRAADVAGNDSEMQKLREENTRLRNALERERRTFEDQAMRLSADSSAAAELVEKIRLLEIENKSLKAAGAKPSAEPAKASECAAPAGDAAMLRAENETLIQEVNTQRNRIAALEDSLDKMAAAMTPEKAKKANTKDTPKEDAEMAAKLAAADRRATESERALAVLRDQLALASAENTRLKAENQKLAQVPAMPAMPAMPPAQVAEETPKENLATLAKLKTLENQMAVVQADRDRMARELETLRNSGAQGRVSVAANNWDLEQATKRFNEAEREIIRLGSLMEQERAKCVAEKKEIEFMLFDPKIAEREQIAKLVKLEEELASARAALGQQNKGREAEISALQKRLADMEARAAQDAMRAANAEARVRTLEQDLASARTSVDQIRKEQGQAAATQISDLEKQIQDLNRQLTTAREESATAQAELARVRASQSDQVAALQKQIGDLTAQLTQAQKSGADIVALQAKQADSERMIADLNAKLASVTQESAQLKTALQEANQQKLANANQTIAMDTLKNEIASLNRQIDNLQNEKTALQAQVAQITTAAGEARATAQAQTARSPAVEVDRISGLPGKTVSAAAQVPAGVAALAAPQPAVVSSATSRVKLMTRGDVDAVLKRAGLTLNGGVQDIASAMGPGRVAYRWQTEGVFGTAEQKVMESPQQFDRMVQEYLDKTRSRCTGQFAAVPAFIESTATRQVSSYEIACVDNNGGGASAAVVFSGVGQTFTIYAHEAAPESMDFAMDARDRVLATVQGTVSR